MDEFKKLVERWEELARRYVEKSDKNVDNRIIARLSAIADTYRICALQLEEVLAKINKNRTGPLQHGNVLMVKECEKELRELKK